MRSPNIVRIMIVEDDVLFAMISWGRSRLSNWRCKG